MIKTTHLIVCIVFALYASPAFAQWTEVSKHIPEPSLSNQSNHYGLSVAIDGNYAVVGSRTSETETYSGVVYVLENTNSGWQTIAKLTQSDRISFDRFGESIDIYGDVIVIGAKNHTANGYYSGSVYVYEKPSSGWVDMTQTAKLTSTDFSINNFFGRSVAIYENTIVVGSNVYNSISNKVYVFEKPAHGWEDMTQSANLSVSKENTGLGFGGSVDIFANNIVVGASRDEGNVNRSGAAYVFEKPDSGWSDMSQTAKLIASDGAKYDSFGFSVAISENDIIIRSHGDDFRSGSVYVYEKPLSGWIASTQTAKLITSDSDSGFGIGSSVSVYKKTIVIGSNRSVYVYEKPEIGWLDMFQTTKLIPPNSVTGDFFGNSIAIYKNSIVVGAAGDNDNGIRGGAAYIMDKTSSDWNSSIKITKTLPEPYLNSDYKYYGSTVAIDGKYAVIGNRSRMAEPVYVLENKGSSWHHIAKLTPSGLEDHKGFGSSVAISGNSIIVGSYRYNNNTGSIYVYEKADSGWRDMSQTAILTASDAVGGDFLGSSIDISDNIIVASASRKGIAYVFEKTGLRWVDMNETIALSVSDRSIEGSSVGAVAISDNIIVLSVFQKSNYYQGSVYLYENNDDNWIPTAVLTASDGKYSDYFGASLAIHNNTIAVSTQPIDSDVWPPGSVYVFEKPNIGWISMTQKAKLTTAEYNTRSRFGSSLAIYEDNIVVGDVGSFYDGSSVQSNPAYVFEKPLTGWADMNQTHTLIPTNTSHNDNFGFSIDIFNGNIIIGEPNVGINSGAVYIYNSELKANIITNVETKGLGESIKIYPNPVYNLLKLNILDINEIDVININGKLVDRIDVRNKTQLNINTSNYAQGVYLLTFKNDNETILKRFVKL